MNSRVPNIRRRAMPYLVVLVVLVLQGAGVWVGLVQVERARELPSSQERTVFGYTGNPLGLAADGASTFLLREVPVRGTWTRGTGLSGWFRTSLRTMIQSQADFEKSAPVLAQSIATSNQLPPWCETSLPGWSMAQQPLEPPIEQTGLCEVAIGLPWRYLVERSRFVQDVDTGGIAPMPYLGTNGIEPIWQIHWGRAAASFGATLAVLLGPFMLVRAFRQVRSAWRHRRGCCTACNYSRKGISPESPCPECGVQPTP
jgi:hypothetical protein